MIFEIRERVDEGQRILEEYDAAQQKKEKPKRGVSRYVVAVGLDGKEIELSGLRREQMILSMAEQTAHDENEAELLEQGLIERRPDKGYDPREYGDPLIDSAASG